MVLCLSEEHLYLSDYIYILLYQVFNLIKIYISYRMDRNNTHLKPYYEG